MRGYVILAAFLSAHGAVPLGGQEPDTIPEVADEPTEPAYAPPRFALSLTVGTAGFGALQNQPVLARRVNSAGAALDSTVLSRSVEADGGFHLGASGVLGLTPIWAVRLGLGVTRTTIKPEYEGEAALFTATAARLADAEATDATILALEAALRMRVPSSRRAQPYLELGASAVRWAGEGGGIGLPGLEDGIRRLGGAAAVGADVPLTDRLAARIHATTRVFRTPFDAMPAGAEGPATSTMTLTFTRPETDPFADGYRELTTTFRLEIGISLGLGRVEAPGDRAAPAESPSPTGR